MPLCEVASARPRNRTANAENDTSMVKRRSRHCNDENEALPKPRSRRVLSKCNWVFCHEPDQNNVGPQIIVTEPNGSNHYLVDPETFASKLRKRSIDFREEADTLMDDTVFGTPTINGQINHARNVLDDGNETQVRMGAFTAQAPMTASAKLRTRLRGGIMQRWRKRISGKTSPLYYTRERCSSLHIPRVYGRTGRTDSLDFSGSRSSDHRCSEAGEVLSLPGLFGDLVI